MRDTIGLTHSQHGAYFLAMLAYWSKGESLTMGELRGVCGREMKRVQEFFIWEGARWHHKRIDLELESARKRSEIAREKSLKAVEARRRLGQI